MKVRIVKCSDGTWWYRDKIGEVIDVINETESNYLISYRVAKYIDKRDAEIITEKDNVNHPSHYTSHPSGIECIDITQHHDFCVGNAIKYLWRAGLKKEEGLTNKEKEIEDLRKALFYINKKINLLENEN